MKNKDEILEAVSARALDEIISLEPGESEQSALDQLLALLKRCVEVMATDFGRSLASVLESELSDRRRRGIRAARSQISNRIQQLLKRGIEEGSIAECDVKMTSFMLAGAVSWVGRWYDAQGELDPEQIASRFAEQFARGLLPRR